MSEIWKHKKTGGRYEVIATGRMEGSGISGPKMIVYRSLSDGRTWIRPATEFMDGRFELQPEEGSER